MAHVNCKFSHLAFKIVSSAIIFILSLERSENSQLQIPNQQRMVQQLNNGVLNCFWIMKILIIMVLCCACFNYCIVFVFIV